MIQRTFLSFILTCFTVSCTQHVLEPESCLFRDVSRQHTIRLLGASSLRGHEDLEPERLVVRGVDYHREFELGGDERLGEQVVQHLLMPLAEHALRPRRLAQQLVLAQVRLRAVFSGIFTPNPSPNEVTFLV